MKYAAPLFALIIALSAPASAGFELEGVVLDIYHAPVSEADVWLTQNRQVTQTQADGEGRFRFANAVPGRAEVVAWKPGGQYAVGGLDLNVVGPGSTTIYLGEPTETTVVATSDAGPVAGARLRTLAVNELFHVSLIDLAAHGFPSPRSDGEGAVTIPFLPRDSYFGFVLSHRSYVDASLAYLPTGRRQAVHMEQGGVISGRVVNADGQGVADARVSVYAPTAQGQQKAAERLTGPDGFYRAPVRPGAYRVTAAHPEYALAYPEPAAVDKRGETVTANLALPEAFQVSGRILGPEGEPAQAVKLTYLLGGVIAASAQTQYDGRFALSVPAGDGVLQVHPPVGLATEKLPRIPVKLVDEDATLDTPIQLKAVPHIAGRVVGPDGEPAPYAVVTAGNAATSQWVVADEEGRFALAPERMPGDRKLRLRAEHRLRFLAQEAEYDLGSKDGAIIELEPYKPEAPEMTKETTQNDLLHMVGKRAPDWACETWVNSEPVRLADLRGKVVALTLWGAFQESGPGRLHVERLRMVSQLFAGVGDVAFIGIHTASLEPWLVEHFTQRWNIEFPVGCDVANFVTFDRYNTTYIPNTILIDKQGVLRFYDVQEKLLELIKALRLRE